MHFGANLSWKNGTAATERPAPVNATIHVDRNFEAMSGVNPSVEVIMNTTATAPIQMSVQNIAHTILSLVIPVFLDMAPPSIANNQCENRSS